MKSTRVCLLHVLTTPRVGKSKIPFQKQKETLPRAGKEEIDLPLRVSYKNDTEEKYIKIVSNEKLTDTQTKLISESEVHSEQTRQK